MTIGTKREEAASDLANIFLNSIEFKDEERGLRYLDIALTSDQDLNSKAIKFLYNAKKLVNEEFDSQE